MLNIGKSYIVQTAGTSRLCADLTIDNHRTTLWFSVDCMHEEWLALGRADPFVVALLPKAMRGGHKIVCEDPISERLHYQLTNGLIPTLVFAGEDYQPITIIAPLTSERVSNQGAVGTGFSGGVDCLYTIMRHGADSEMPLTHSVVVNRQDRLWDENTFHKICQRAELFGSEQNLQAVFVDTNYRSVLPAVTDNLVTFRYISCVLALQGLFKAYLVSSGPNAAKLNLDLNVCDRYDLLTVNCVSNESLSFYLSGSETTRGGKLAALAQWPPSRRWLNACTIKEGEYNNCGHCKKCIHDMTMLYALGQLEQYNTVFDTADYLRHLPARIGYILANRDKSESCTQAVQLLKEQNTPIPSAAYIYEKQFRRAKQNQEIIQGARI